MIKIGIVGVNGLVGKAIIDSLVNLELIDNDLYDFYFYGRQYDEIDVCGAIMSVEKFELIHLDNLDYTILAVENNLAKEIYEYIFEKELKITVIDNSSEFRLFDNVPLCIPEINSNTLHNKKDTKFISNPNCVTTLMCMVLKPLLNLANIKRIVASTYQAASGAGYKGLEELKTQTEQSVNGYNLTTKFWKKQYVYNVFSHNSSINTDTLFNEEEMKLVNETKKILEIDCKITATCIRVPTLRSHCISLNVEFDKSLEKDNIINELNKFPGVVILDNIEENKFPEPIITSEKTDVYVGRIRPDIDDDKCWNFFISGDQLLKGAGYNSVQILKYLLEN